ncbi:PIG-L deacetylase family protein [Streptomyces sp. NPDC053048]|uniref:PIG-L deacetylase family protein n=1 Tax=Streptomyces sp. NPDC053048 TaxID=3365694 RepID=UPI0037CD166B
MDDLVLRTADRRPPESVLVVAARPADIEVHAAGTVMRWVDRGTRATYCVVTDGEADGREEVRRAEQVLAAKLAGVTDVRFLGRPADAPAEPAARTRDELERLIHQVRPRRVIVPADLAPVTSRLLAEDREGPVRELWVMSAPEPNQYVDVTAVLDRKLEALRAHASRAAALPDPEEPLRARLAAHARVGGLPPGRVAEAFEVVRAVRHTP